MERMVAQNKDGGEMDLRRVQTNGDRVSTEWNSRGITEEKEGEVHWEFGSSLERGKSRGTVT